MLPLTRRRRAERTVIAILRAAASDTPLAAARVFLSSDEAHAAVARFLADCRAGGLSFSAPAAPYVSNDETRILALLAAAQRGPGHRRPGAAALWASAASLATLLTQTGLLLPSSTTQLIGEDEVSAPAPSLRQQMLDFMRREGLAHADQLAAAGYPLAVLRALQLEGRIAAAGFGFYRAER